MRKAIRLWLVTLFLAGAPAPAVALDAEGLKQDIETALAGGLSPYLPQPVEFQQVRTYAAGEAVQVEIWGVIVPMPDQSGRLVIGDVGFTVVETEPGYYHVSDVTLPGGATLRGPQGNDEAYVNYRLEAMEGLWSSAILSFLDLDLDLREVEAIVPAEGLGLSMARVAMTSDHTRRPDGLIDVEGHMTGEAVKALAPGEARMELGGFEASARIEGYDIAAVERIMSEFEALTADGAPPTPEELSAVLGRLANENLLPETFVEQFGLSGLTMSGPGGEPLFALDSAEISLKGEGLNEGFGTGSFGLRFGGLATPDQPTAGNSMREIVPHSGGIIVTAHRLPLQEIWTVLMQSASMAAMTPSQPGQPDAFGAMVGIQMLAAIQRAGTSLTLDRLFSESPAAGVSVEGKIEPQPGSALGFTAKGEARITGLDRLIELAQQDANPQGANPQGGPGMPLGMLTRLKEIGRRQQGGDGKAVDNYEIELTARGEFLVNGEPFGPPGMAPGGPGQTPQ